MQVFSYSRLDKKSRCPWAFAQSYILEKKEPVTEALVLGKSVHTLIEMARVLKVEREEELKFLAESIAGVASLPVNAEEILTLATRRKVTESIGKGFTEEYFKISLSPEDPFGPELQGYIDYYEVTDTEIVVTDWKTNRLPYNPLDTHQLGLYALYLTQKYNKPVCGRLVFLRTGETREHLYTPEDIEKARRWAYDTALDIQQKIYALNCGGNLDELFPATPGDVCEYCGYAEECAKLADILEDDPGEFVSMKEAEKYGREICRLERAADLMKERLKQYVEKNGPVPVGKKQWDLVISQYWKFPQEAMKKAEEKMKDQNIDPLTVFSLTATGLKKLNWTDKEIAELGASIKPTKNFKLVSIK
ncbi:PD-(D/E)XK nuclease superfamily protein [Desulforamulus putei DSM 12395]|uniref:PD-(D/E)XK nuclease superfamily protein n=1 Tax=Desulforamulus putei DSM 12395 TaxID=1121429 RepID=A0A1M4ZDN7_9FIRM|nr:PD-(D/E)XK nuclease family protein [Desulforamulus putei]SHF15696.1 PD-(D/E)XK nuclease superfamily protein [Desulforamulus putei DSM 12395]